MGKKTCENCGQIIGDLEESFYQNNHVVCKTCNALLEKESQALKTTDSDTKIEIATVEIQPKVAVNTEHESTIDLIQQDEQEKNYGGIHRTGYFFGILALAVVSAISTVATQKHGTVAPGSIIPLIFLFFIVINRLKNIGMNGKWSLLILLPLANIFIVVKCAICPEGYEDTKKLDTAGKIIAGIFIGIVVLSLVCVIIGSLSY